MNAVISARAALETWADTPLPDRSRLIERVAAEYKTRKADLAETICRDTGKPRWESATEVEAMMAKAAISIAAATERRSGTSRTINDTIASTLFRPIGVLAILGPFNMPGHLPNGHLMPAVLAGNTVIFKPSELATQVGEMLGEIWNSAGFPRGVFNLLQGGPDIGAALVSDPEIDGVLFTGSAAGGAAIHRALAGCPEKMLALEMGGNNPLIVWDCADRDAAAHWIVQSAFITSGQRCTCARRLIIAASDAEPLLSRLTALMSRVRVGLYTDNPEPFMGTVISAAAARKLLQAQADLISRGAEPLIAMRGDPRSDALLHPGLIDVTEIERDDVELFGPLLQVIRVADFPAALKEANRTRYGLSAGLISDRADLYSEFRRHIRAGVITFNRPTTGARSDLPFGGLGRSGNHRPSAYHAADYCSDAVAALESSRVLPPEKLPPGIDP